MELKDLSKPLTVDQIDFRIQSINKGGFATILAYKDARCDMQRLDDVCTPLSWKREHSRDNHNCTVSIYNKAEHHWVGKEDTGTESMAEAQKGLASDSFKRACFNWGIGRELYDYPVITIKLIGDGSDKKADEWRFSATKKDRWGNPQPEPTWYLKLKEWVWYSQFDNGKVSYLAVTDGTLNAKGKANVRFTWGHRKQTEEKQ